MSQEGDDLFARWSRRKLAARSLGARSPEEAERTDGAQGIEADAEQPVAASDSAVAESPEPLPSLEDVTADGDLSAFLRKGVPTALKNEAMRKMWSLDPAIRNHVGLAEYAWNFNQPGAMPGFGPLEAGKSVADFLSSVSREAPTQPEEADPEAPAPLSDRPTAAAPEQDSGLPPAESAQPPAMPETPRQSTTDVAAAFGSAEDRAESSPAPRPRHGGAMPR